MSDSPLGRGKGRQALGCRKATCPRGVRSKSEYTLRVLLVTVIILRLRLPCDDQAIFALFLADPPIAIGAGILSES